MENLGFLKELFYEDDGNIEVLAEAQAEWALREVECGLSQQDAESAFLEASEAISVSNAPDMPSLVEAIEFGRYLDERAGLFAESRTSLPLVTGYSARPRKILVRARARSRRSRTRSSVASRSSDGEGSSDCSGDSDPEPPKPKPAECRAHHSLNHSQSIKFRFVCLLYPDRSWRLPSRGGCAA